jgi:hypothetical protein
MTQRETAGSRRQESIPMVIVTGVLLVIYGALLLYGLMSPSNDPQRGMAQGALSLFFVVILTLVVLLWFGARYRHPRLVYIIFGICVSPALSLPARGIYLIVRWWRNR